MRKGKVIANTAAALLSVGIFGYLMMAFSGRLTVTVMGVLISILLPGIAVVGLLLRHNWARILVIVVMCIFTATTLVNALVRLDSREIVLTVVIVLPSVIVIALLSLGSVKDYFMEGKWL